MRYAMKGYLKYLSRVSIQRKQMFIIMLTTGVALLLASAAFTFFEISAFREEMVQDLSMLARIVGNEAVTRLDSRNRQSAQETLAVMKTRPDLAGLCIFDRNGKLLAEYDRPLDGLDFRPPDQIGKEGFVFGREYFSLFQPIISGGKIVGTVYLEADLRTLYSRLERHAAIAGAVLFVSLLVAFILSAGLQRVVSQPIRALATAARKVALEKDFSVRVAKHSEDEIGVLIDGFNNMLSQIEERDANLERRVGERTLALANSVSLLNATLNSTADGVLVVDCRNQITSYNSKFIEMWKFRREDLIEGDDQKILPMATKQVKDEEGFLRRIRELYSQPDAESHDVLELKDGRVFERYSQPQRLDGQCVGRVWCFRDVTERKNADELLRRTEQIYRQAIAGAGAVPYSYDYGTRTYSFIGEGIEELIGYKPFEMSPNLWTQITQESIMLGETGGMDKAAAAQKALTGELRHWRCDMRVITRNGKSRWISDASVQKADENGKAIGSMGILQDITERKQSELGVLAFSKLGQNLSSAASREEAARIIGDVADDFFRWDAFWMQLYSEKDDMLIPVYNADILDGKRVVDDEVRPKKATELHHRLIRNGAELVLRDGDSFLEGITAFGNRSRPSASLMFAPIRLGDRVVGLLSVQSYKRNAFSQADLETLQMLADHSAGALERIRLDEERREFESQFEGVWDTSPDGMRLTDRGGKVLLVNDSYCRIVEKPREQIEGQSLGLIYSPDTAERVLSIHRRAIDYNCSQSHIEDHVTLWNGRKIWIEVSKAILSRPGQPAMLLSILRDVTQRKEAEAELQRTHKQLLDVSRAAGMAEVATSVLHNVGNVLNSVNVAATLLGDKLRKSRAVKLRDVADLMKEHQADLAAFISNDSRGKHLPDYLDHLARYVADEQEKMISELAVLLKNIEHIKEIVAMQQSYAKISGVTDTIEIADLVDDAVRMNDGALARHGVELVREYQKVPPVTVERHKVLQILINLIRNAKYACDEAGRKDKRLILRIGSGTRGVRIDVLDNGVGIRPENLTRIFNHGFTTRKAGHGFGLHSGALIASEMGGALIAQSEGPGLGAQFTLELPLQPPKTPGSTADGISESVAAI